MKFSDLKFKSIKVNGETLKYVRVNLENGFVVSIAKKEDNDFYNAAIIKDGAMIITEVHDRTDMFIVGTDYTFDLIDNRKVTTFLKNVEKLNDSSEFSDVEIVNGALYIGKKHPSNEKILNVIKKITPFEDENENNE
jgi:hypothetical protein